MSYKDYIILIFGSFLLIAVTGIANADNIDANTFGKCKQEGTVASYCKDPSKFHKKWAKEVLHGGQSNKDRYLENIAVWTGKSINTVSIKPKLLNFEGVNEKDSMKSYKGKGEMGIVIGAEEFAYNGKEFWTVTTDFSGCKNLSYYSDCKQSKGSSRIENRAKGNSVSEGQEKWIHYAIKPVNNVLFPGNNSRRFTIGQCHPGDNGNHMGLTWMLRIRGGQLYFATYFKHQDFNYQKENGEWGVRNKWIGEDVSWKTTHDKLKDFRPDIKEGMNGVGADGEWTSILIRQINSTDPSKGKFEVYLDGDWTNPVYEYAGATTIKQKKSCYFKFGLYTNGNMTATDMATTENMTIHMDAMAVANSKEEVLALVAKKDK